MDYLEQSKIEYEYFKLAKRIETFAFRCHFFEVSMNRTQELMCCLIRMILDAGLDPDLRPSIRDEIDAEAENIHYDYYHRFRRQISKCHESPGLEWINPVSMSNQFERDEFYDEFDGEEALKGLQLPQATMIVKAMLMDLCEEARQIEEEHDSLISEYGQPDGAGIRRFFDGLIFAIQELREIKLKALAKAEEEDIAPGELEALKEMAREETPFQIVREAIENFVMPKIDKVLVICSETSEGEDE